MSSVSERSFGAKLRKAYTMVMYLGTFTNFNPPREEDKSEKLKTHLDDITTMNAEVAKAGETYRMAVAKRQLLFKDDPASMEKLLSPIMGAIESIYGKKSTEYKLISTLIKKLRSSKVEKPPKAEDPQAAAKISRSSRSFGSLTQHFNDIISNLEQFPGYTPANANISIASLKTLSKSLSESNQAVDTAFANRSDVINRRSKMYDDLRDRANRIKAHAKSVYGINSKEFKLIRGLDV